MTKKRPRPKSRLEIRSYFPFYGAYYRRWQWRCQHRWLDSYCPGHGTRITSMEEALEECRKHAWIVHGVRI